MGHGTEAGYLLLGTRAHKSSFRAFKLATSTTRPGSDEAWFWTAHACFPRLYCLQLLRLLGGKIFQSRPSVKRARGWPTATWQFLLRPRPRPILRSEHLSSCSKYFNVACPAIAIAPSSFHCNMASARCSPLPVRCSWCNSSSRHLRL